MNNIVDFDRKELFKHYNEMDNPFIIMTIPLNVTKVVEYCKVHKNFDATMGFLIGKAVNDVNAFKYRYDKDNFYYYDRLCVNFTERVDEQIGFFECESDNLMDFVSEFKEKTVDISISNTNNILNIYIYDMNVIVLFYSFLFNSFPLN